MEDLSDDDVMSIETIKSEISILETGLDNIQSQMSTLMEFMMKERLENKNNTTAGGQHSVFVTPSKANGNLSHCSEGGRYKN